jgi:transposase
VLPKTPLPEATLDRVIMCIWCLCSCGMQWRAACKLADLPFGTVYSCFAHWQRLGLWKALLLDLLRSWRIAFGDNPAPLVVVVDSRSCRSAPTCGKRGIDGGKKVKGVKINLVVDKHGFPLAVNISKANVHDTVGIIPALRKASADGFRGTALATCRIRGKSSRRPAGASASRSRPRSAGPREPSFRPGCDGSSTSSSPGTAESLSLLIPHPRAGHVALLNVVHWLEWRHDREPLAGPNDVVATAGVAAAQGDDPPRPADPTLSCRSPTDRIEGGCP